MDSIQSGGRLTFRFSEFINVSLPCVLCQLLCKVPVGRVPRVSRLMALAIRLDQLIRNDVVTDQAELARLGHVTRARLTQIMNLLCLAPDLQEQIRFLPLTDRGRDAITEKQLRPIAAVPSWKKQRQMWRERFHNVRDS